jgi:hypothetical protein
MKNWRDFLTRHFASRLAPTGAFALVQAQAAADFEQQAGRRVEADFRTVTVGAAGEVFEGAALGGWVALEALELADQRLGLRLGLANAQTGGCRCRIDGNDDATLLTRLDQDAGQG